MRDIFAWGQRNRWICIVGGIRRNTRCLSNCLVDSHCTRQSLWRCALAAVGRRWASAGRFRPSRFCARWPRARGSLWRTWASHNNTTTTTCTKVWRTRHCSGGVSIPFSKHAARAGLLFISPLSARSRLSLSWSPGQVAISFPK